MVQATINISEDSNQILNIVKAKYKLKDKSAAIDLVVTQYGAKILEPELRPEFIAEIQQIMKQKPIFVGRIKKFYRRVDNFNEQDDECHYFYDILFCPTFLMIVKKLTKKNEQQYDMIVNKTHEICINPHRYKSLKYP